MNRLIIEAEMTQLLRWRSELREIFGHRGDKTLSAWLREKRKEVVALEKDPSIGRFNSEPRRLKGHFRG